MQQTLQRRHGVGRPLALSVAVACGWLVLPARGGEAVRFTDSVESVSAREDSGKSGRPSISPGGGNGLILERGPSAPPTPRGVFLPPPAIAAPVLTEKELDQLDRKRNWIFQTSTSLVEDQPDVEEALGVDTPRLDKEWGTDRRVSKSLTRFIEGAPVVTEERKSPLDARAESDPSSQGSTAKKDDQEFGTDRGNLSWIAAPDDRKSGANLNDDRPDSELLNSFAGDDSSRPGDPGDRDRLVLRPRFGSVLGTERAADEGAARGRSVGRFTAREFAGPGATGVSAAAGLDVVGGVAPGIGAGVRNDPVNLFPDLTRQAINPVTAPGNGAAGLTALSGAGNLTTALPKAPSLIRPRFEDVGLSGLRAGSAASVLDTQPAPRPRIFNAPVAFEIPKRSF